MVYWHPAVATSESVSYPFPTCKLRENFVLSTFTSDTKTHTSFFVPQPFSIAPHSVSPSFLDSNKRSSFCLRTSGFLSPFSLQSDANFHSLTYMAEKLLLFFPSSSAMSKSDMGWKTLGVVLQKSSSYTPLLILLLLHIPCKGNLGP